MAYRQRVAAQARASYAGTSSSVYYPYMAHPTRPMYPQYYHSYPVDTPQNFETTPTPVFTLPPDAGYGGYNSEAPYHSNRRSYSLLAKSSVAHTDDEYSATLPPRRHRRRYSDAEPKATLHVAEVVADKETTDQETAKRRTSQLVQSMVTSLRGWGKNRSKTRESSVATRVTSDKPDDEAIYSTFETPRSASTKAIAPEPPKAIVQEEVAQRMIPQSQPQEIPAPKRPSRGLPKDPSYEDLTLAANTRHNSMTLYPRYSVLARSTGYETDAVVSRRPRSSSQSETVAKPDPTTSATGLESRFRPDATMMGWFNKRGDQFHDSQTVIRPAKHRQYPKQLEGYPDVGEGYMDNIGRLIDSKGRLVRRSAQR